ncbi:MAG: hypothetical protein Q8R67_26000 [Rhodoferax sp.]|nr:hypothetical protein [Rhodoferax sp.]MDP3655126.1 hypothetical protein [Rhodoferax sp.]
MRKFLVGLIVALQFVYGHAQVASFTAVVGEETLALPQPIGFTEPLAALPELRKFAELFTGPPHRLLALYVEDSDFQLAMQGISVRMKRYFLVQALRATEKKTVSVAEFSHFKSKVRGSRTLVDEKLQGEIQSQLDNIAKKLGENTDSADLSLKLGETKSLGIFYDEPNAISELAIGNMALNTGQARRDSHMLVGMTLANIKGKLVLFFAYSPLRSAADSEWIRNQTQTWIREATTIN